MACAQGGHAGLNAEQKVECVLNYLPLLVKIAEAV